MVLEALEYDNDLYLLITLYEVMGKEQGIAKRFVK